MNTSSLDLTHGDVVLNETGSIHRVRADLRISCEGYTTVYAELSLDAGTDVIDLKNGLESRITLNGSDKATVVVGNYETKTVEVVSELRRTGGTISYGAFEGFTVIRVEHP